MFEVYVAEQRYCFVSPPELTYMLSDIMTGAKYIDKKTLLVFPLAIFAVGAVPPLLEMYYTRTPAAEITVAVVSGLITAIELLRVRGKLRDSSTWD